MTCDELWDKRHRPGEKLTLVERLRYSFCNNVSSRKKFKDLRKQADPTVIDRKTERTPRIRWWDDKSEDLAQVA